MSDTVLQELTVRMATDTEFAQAVHADPAVALQDMDLTADEVDQLRSLSADTAGGAEGLEERQSKSSLMFGGLESGHVAPPHVAPPHEDVQAPWIPIYHPNDPK
jgi:hypothetical protein